MTALPETHSRRAAHPPIRVPSPREPVDTPAPPRADRHHRTTSTANRLWLLVGRAGSVTTLAAMLVLAGAAAGLTDGAAPTGDAAAVATTTLH